MFLTTEHRNGAAPIEEMESGESLIEIARKDLNGHFRKPRLKLAPVAPAPPEEAPAPVGGPALAMFCYEDPSSVVGRFVIRLAAALAVRKSNVHLFCRKEFDHEAPDVTV